MTLQPVGGVGRNECILFSASLLPVFKCEKEETMDDEVRVEALIGLY